jgi:hypothetical protein
MISRYNVWLSSDYKCFQKQNYKRYQLQFTNQYIDYVVLPSVFINLEALTDGKGNHSKADRLFYWLSQPTDPIRIGSHNVLAARTTTENVVQSDWDG